jgi:hypothetical protein
VISNPEVTRTLATLRKAEFGVFHLLPVFGLRMKFLMLAGTYHWLASSIKGNSLSSLITRLMFAAIVYGIWRFVSSLS